MISPKRRVPRARLLAKGRRFRAGSVGPGAKEHQPIIDILHIATAVHLGAKTFLTFDANQKLLAETEGLEVPIKRKCRHFFRDLR